MLGLGGGCEDDAKTLAREVNAARAEFSTLFTRTPQVSYEVKELPGGDDGVDVKVKFESPPPGYTPEEVRTNVNIVVRKHVHKVHAVDVQF